MATEKNQVVTELTVVDKGREGVESHLAWLSKVVAKSKEAAEAARRQAEEAKRSSDSQTESWSRVAGSFDRLKRSMDGSFGVVARFVKDFDTLNKASVQMIGTTNEINAALQTLKVKGDLSAQTMNILANAVKSVGQSGKAMRDAMVEAAGLAQAFDSLKRSVNEQYDYTRKLERADADLATKKEILRRAVEKGIATTQDALAVEKLLTQEYERQAREMDPAIRKSRERTKALLEEMAASRKLREEEAARTLAQMKESTKTRSQFGGINFDEIGRYTKALYDLQQAQKRTTMSSDEFQTALKRINDTLSPASIAAKKQAEEHKKATEEQIRLDREAARAAEERSRAQQNLYNRVRQGRVDESRRTQADYQTTAQFRTMGVDDKYWQNLTRYTRALYDLNEMQKAGTIRGAEYDTALKKIHDTMSPLAIKTKEVEETQRKTAEQTRKAAEEAVRANEKQARTWDDFRRSIDPVYDRQQRVAEGHRMIADAASRGLISTREAALQNALLAKSFIDAEKSGGGFLGRLMSINAVIATLGIGFAVKRIIDLADTWTSLEGRLRQVTDTQSEFTKTQGELFDIAQRTRVEYEAVVQLYTKMARATEDLGLSQINLGKAMETATKAAQLGGGSREGINAALYQFSQGIASNRLGGDELRSILEQAPGLGRAIADGLGVAYGKLRELGTEGKLTADVILKALTNAASSVEAAWGKVPVTVGQSLTQLQNSILRLVGELNTETKFTQPIIDAINEVRKRLDDPAFKEALVVWAKLFADAVNLALDTFRWLADHMAEVKAVIGGLIAMKVAGWFGELALAAAGAAKALGMLMTGGALAGGGVIALLGGITAAVGLATAGYIYFNQEVDKAVDIQEEFNNKQLRAKQIQDELTTATGSKLDKLEEERQQLIKNAQAEVDLQIAQINRREYTLKAQESGFDPQLAARAKEEREQLKQELEALLKQRDEINKITATPGREPLVEPKKGPEQVLPDGMDPKEYDKLIDRLKVSREEMGQVEAVALKLKLTQAKATEEQINNAMAIQEQIDKMKEFADAIRDKDAAQTASLKEELTQLAIVEAEGARTAAYWASINQQMANSSAEGIRGIAALARAELVATEAGKAAFDDKFQQRMGQINQIVKDYTPKATKGGGFNPKSDMEDFIKQTERNINANNRLAEAYGKGEKAIRQATVAAQVEQNVLRLGEKNRERITELVRREEESKARLAASKFLDSQKQELENEQRLGDAIAQGEAAVRMANKENEIRNKLRELGIDLMTKEGIEQANLIRMTMEELEAKKLLNQHKADMRQGEENIRMSQLEVSLAGQEEHVRERILFLEQERSRIRETYGPGQEAQAREAWDMAKRTAAANEELSITNDRLERARDLADDVGQFIVDGFVNVEKSGKSVFENIFEGAQATAKRFIANLVAEFLKQKILLPIAFQMMGGPVGSMGGFFGGGGSATPYGMAAGAGGVQGGMGVGGGGGLGGMFSQNGMFSGVGKWVGSWWNKPIMGGPQQPTTAMMSGIDDVGQLGYAQGTVASPGSMGAMSWGQGLGAAGGGLFAGFGIGSMVKRGNKAQGALGGAAAGALQGAMVAGPWGAVIGGIAGAIGGLFGAGNKPSNHAVGTTLDVSTGEFKNWDSGKGNDNTRQMRDGVNNAMKKVLDLFEGIGAKFPKGVSVYTDIGERDDWEVRVGGGKFKVQKGDTDAMMSIIFKELGKQAQGLGEDVGFVLRHSAEKDLQKLGQDLDFATGFKDQIEIIKDSVGGLASVFATGKNEAKEFTKNITDFLDNTVRVFASNSASGLPQYASGTDYAKAGMALVGEKGPELVMLRGGEKIFDADETKGIMRSAVIGQTQHFLAYIDKEEASLLRKRGGGKNASGGQKFGPGGIPAFEVDSFAFERTSPVSALTTAVKTLTAEMVKTGKQMDSAVQGQRGWDTSWVTDPNAVPLSSMKAELEKRWSGIDSAENINRITLQGEAGITYFTELNKEIDATIKAFKEAGEEIPEAVRKANEAIDSRLTGLGVKLPDDGAAAAASAEQARKALDDALTSRGMNMTAYNNFVAMSDQAGRGEKINPTRGDGNPHDFEGLLKMLNLVEDAMRSVGTAVPDSFFSLRKQLEALDAARKAIDAKIATGGIDVELTETETSVERLKGYWSEMRGALEAVGYAGDTLNRKLQEGLANGMRTLAERYNESYNAAMFEATGRGYINTINGAAKTRDLTRRDLAALGDPNADQKANDLFKAQVKSFAEGTNLTVKQLLDLGNTFNHIPELVEAANEALKKFMDEFLTKLTQQFNSAGGMGYRNEFMNVLEQQKTNMKEIQDAGFSEDFARQSSEFIARGSFAELLKNASLTNEQLKDVAATFGQYPGVLEGVNIALAKNQEAMDKTVMNSLISAQRMLDPEFAPMANATMLSLGIDTQGNPAFRDSMTGFTNSARNGTAGIGGYQNALKVLEDQFRNGKITAEQFGSMVEYLTTEFDKQRQKQLQAAQELIQKSTTIQGVYLNLKSMATGKNSMTGDNVLAMSGAGYDNSARGALWTFFNDVGKDEADIAKLISTIDSVTESYKNGQLTGEQYTNIIGEVNTAWGESAQRINQAKEELKGFQSQIKDFLKSMETDDLSVNGPEAKLQAAQEQFRELLTKVQAGDNSKIPELLQSAGTYRELGNSFYNNTQGYAYIDKEIKTALKGVDENTDTQINKLDAQTTLLSDGNGLLSSLNMKVDQSRSATVDSLNSLRSLQDAHKHENWVQFQSLTQATNAVAGSVAQSVSVQNAQIQYLAQHSQLLAQIAQTTAQQIQIQQAPKPATLDFAGITANVVGSGSVNARGATGDFGEIKAARVTNDNSNLLSIGEVQALQRAAGYTGSFADGNAWQTFVNQNSSNWNTLYSTAQNKAYVGNGTRWWYTNNELGSFVVNREIARATGYTGNFGNDFDYWMAFQPASTRSLVNSYYQNYGWGEFAKYAKGGIHGLQATDVRSLVGGISTNPTLSLHAEGGVPEAYVPLSDGRTIPVTIKYAMSAMRSGNETAIVESLLERVEEAVDRNTALTARGEQGTIDSLEELLVETKEIRRQASMEKGKR